MKKAMALILASLLILSFVLSGCGKANSTEGTKASTVEQSQTKAASENSQAATPAEKVTLKFWTDFGDERALNYFKAFTQKFPNVDLQITVYSTEEYKSQSRLALSSGTGPDVWTTNSGEFLTQFIDGGGAMDITDTANKRGWLDRLDKGSRDVGLRNGKLYAMPWGGYYPWQVLFANKDFFTKNSIPYPTTVDEMIDVAKQIKAKGMQPIAWGNKDGWPGQIMFGDYMMQLIDPSIIEKLNKGEAKWTESQEAKTALDTIVKLAKGGAFTVGYTNQDHQAAISSWLAQKAALLYNGTWFYGGVEKEGGIKFAVETIPLPLYSKDATLKGAQLFPDPAIFINPKTTVPEMAIEFFDYVTDVGYYKILSEINKCLTPNPTANKELTSLPDWLKSDYLTKQFDLPLCNYWTVDFPTSVEEVLASQIKLAIDGKVTADQAMQAIEKEHQNQRK